jgi:uroporphyrinogen-III synthase
VPERFLAEGVLAALSARSDVSGSRILYLAAEGSREVLPDGLRVMHCEVDVVRIYRTAMDGAGAEPVRRALRQGEVDAVTFASASAVRGYVDAVSAELASAAPAISIGPVTSAAVRAAGIELAAEASDASIGALTRATIDALARSGASSPLDL